MSLVRIAEAQPHAIIVQPQRLQHEAGHLDAAAELVGHLLLGAEDVGVVLGEAADARHAVQLARLLEAVHRAELGQPQRQVAVAPRLRLVDRHVVRAVHRPQQVAVAVLHLDRRKLRILVIRIMARSLVQMHVADDRRVDRLVAAADQLAVEEVLQLVANHGPLGQPKDQARADRRLDQEQFELLAQHAVVAPPGLFELAQVLVEFLLGEEGRAVEPLQLLARGVAFPIGPGHREELERADGARAGHVRAAAEIDELALTIERDGRLVGQPVLEMLDLQRLAQDRGRTGWPPGDPSRPARTARPP